MFEQLGNAELAAEIERETRAAAASDSRRLRLIAEMVSRRVAEQDDELLHWACDYWDATAAEVAAAMRVGHRAASKEMCIAVALGDRFPRVAALFDEGLVNSQLISTITWRTRLVEDAEALRLIDEGLAQRVTDWGPLSVTKLEQAIDTLIERHDPGALRRLREAVRARDVCLGKTDDVSGTTSLWGRLLATDGAALRKRMAYVISGVCADDPRTAGQRRSDALGVIAALGDRLRCQCGNPDCPASEPDARAANTVVYVLADKAALEGEPDPYLSGDYDGVPVPPDHVVDETPRKKPATAVLLNGGVVPTPLLAELIANGAKVRELIVPCDEAERRYRPSVKLAAFVRMRDMTCTFPGCGRAAESCDIDHTVPYPNGVTHASNTKCLCRTHHLLKTFWVGWSDSQQPDGSIVWTTPSGLTYTTRPASQLFFPHWNTTTAVLPPAAAAPITTHRGAMMPRRKHTRAAQWARQIRAERALNEAYLAERAKPPPG
ncbi:HNH endonuclease signature motif containing protein [Mycobacterium sp. 155]|uniref:HNH endonuclease signature motif containing protein n=1 Tax=Mycobacterium sp. 155 TaxID=1157943 RepID=UPI000368049B|nr:HNH endonuclease signature motif containing protein [Mycobacterium sp. 155]